MRRDWLVDAQFMKASAHTVVQAIVVDNVTPSMAALVLL
jgi:hypothetical protein